MLLPTSVLKSGHFTAFISSRYFGWGTAVRLLDGAAARAPFPVKELRSFCRIEKRTGLVFLKIVCRERVDFPLKMPL